MQQPLHSARILTLQRVGEPRFPGQHGELPGDLARQGIPTTFRGTVLVPHGTLVVPLTGSTAPTAFCDTPLMVWNKPP